MSEDVTNGANFVYYSGDRSWRGASHNVGGLTVLYSATLAPLPPSKKHRRVRKRPTRGPRPHVNENDLVHSLDWADGGGNDYPHQGSSADVYTDNLRAERSQCT
jgi:hypothetical protein